MNTITLEKQRHSYLYSLKSIPCKKNCQLNKKTQQNVPASENYNHSITLSELKTDRVSVECMRSICREGESVSALNCPTKGYD